MQISRDRTHIYYWKCDRAAAFHGTEATRDKDPEAAEQLRQALARRFPDEAVRVWPAEGQGNHRTFRAAIGAREAFVRTEDGPEHDSYFDVETLVIGELRGRSLPVPYVLACDCDRQETPFAWQALERVPYPDLNQAFKRGELPLEQTAESIGEAVARWQELRPPGFGPFSAALARRDGALAGLHNSYPAYYFLQLHQHLSFLTQRGFLTEAQAQGALDAIGGRLPALCLERGCLVHKDLALWNILGEPGRIAAYIDWDDAISGDPMDDLSLLACFHDGPTVARALAGYARVKPLPPDHLTRFWLHLLRNMLVKAVIRVGAGYFQRSDSFFLIGAGCSGADLERFTRARIEIALQGLTKTGDLSILT